MTRYISTRGEAPELGFCDVMLTGLARDGGLYVPATWPRLAPEAIAGLFGRPSRQRGGRRAGHRPIEAGRQHDGRGAQGGDGGKPAPPFGGADTGAEIDCQIQIGEAPSKLGTLPAAKVPRRGERHRAAATAEAESLIAVLIQKPPPGMAPLARGEVAGLWTIRVNVNLSCWRKSRYCGETRAPCVQSHNFL